MKRCGLLLAFAFLFFFTFTERVSAQTYNADVNGDGIVNGTDLSTVISNFGAAGLGSPIAGEINATPPVDIFDYTIVVANYGTTPVPSTPTPTTGSSCPAGYECASSTGFSCAAGYHNDCQIPPAGACGALEKCCTCLPNSTPTPPPEPTPPSTSGYHAGPGTDNFCLPDGRFEVNVLTTSSTRLGSGVWNTIKVYNTTGTDLGFLKDFRVPDPNPGPTANCDNFTYHNAYETDVPNFPGEYYRFGGSNMSFRQKGLPQFVTVRAVNASGTPLSAMSGQINLGPAPTLTPTPTPIPTNPIITSISPLTVVPGDRVTIHGNYFITAGTGNVSDYRVLLLNVTGGTDQLAAPVVSEGIPTPADWEEDVIAFTVPQRPPHAGHIVIWIGVASLQWPDLFTIVSANTTPTPTPPSCVQNGRHCSTHSDCCSGNCLAQTCQNPPPPNQ